MPQAARTRKKMRARFKGVKCTMLKNEHLVIDYFGYWPKFCDGRIVEFSIRNEKRILLTIFYIDSDRDKRAGVELEFFDIFNVNIKNVNHQNIIDELTILDGEAIKVELEACVGLNGWFNCKEASVLNVHT